MTIPTANQTACATACRQIAMLMPDAKEVCDTLYGFYMDCDGETSHRDARGIIDEIGKAVSAMEFAAINAEEARETSR